MKVILTKDVADLGSKGDIVDVADGYGRNYLLPRSLAVVATSGALQQAEAMREARVESERRARDQAEALASALAGSPVVMAARAGDEGRLFGSVAAADIAEAIKKFSGEDVDRKIIDLSEPIKAIGRHQVTLRPHPDVSFSLTLEVIPA